MRSRKPWPERNRLHSVKVKSLHFHEFLLLILALFLEMKKTDQNGQKGENDGQHDARLQHGGRGRDVDVGAPLTGFGQRNRADNHRRIGDGLLERLEGS